MEAAEPSLRHAVVVLIRREDGALLVIKRAEGDRYAGYWNPVTGAIEEEDQGWQASTCRREAMEEVGLEVEVLGKVWESTTSGAHFILHWWLARPVGSTNVQPQPSEVADFCWVQPDEISTFSPVFADTRHFLHHLYENTLENLRQRVKFA